MISSPTSHMTANSHATANSTQHTTRGLQSPLFHHDGRGQDESTSRLRCQRRERYHLQGLCPRGSLEEDDGAIIEASYADDADRRGASCWAHWEPRDHLMSCGQ